MTLPAREKGVGALSCDEEEIKKMNIYLKCLVSFFLGGLCIYLGSTMTGEGKDQQAITYFLYGVGLVNIWIGARDLSLILRSKK
jgi:hypothetical protein